LLSFLYFLFFCNTQQEARFRFLSFRRIFFVSLVLHCPVFKICVLAGIFHLVEFSEILGLLMSWDLSSRISILGNGRYLAPSFNTLFVSRSRKSPFRVFFCLKRLMASHRPALSVGGQNVGLVAVIISVIALLVTLSRDPACRRLVTAAIACIQRTISAVATSVSRSRHTPPALPPCTAASTQTKSPTPSPARTAPLAPSGAPQDVAQDATQEASVVVAAPAVAAPSRATPSTATVRFQLPTNSGGEEKAQTDMDDPASEVRAPGAASPSPKRPVGGDELAAARELARRFFTGHERLGHVVTVKVRKPLASRGPSAAGDADPAAAAAAASEAPTREQLVAGAAALAATIRPVVHLVMLDEDGCVGELRRPTHAPLYQDSAAALKASKELADTIQSRAQRLGWLPDARRPSNTAASTTAALAASRANKGAQFQLTLEMLSTLRATPTFTSHTEDGTRYALDASRVMFCSGNTTERMHFLRGVPAGGNLVVDMFAGIGYFTLPLARSTPAPARIVALEKNPDSCMYLACNAALNRVGDRIVIFNGDNRRVGDLYLRQADRVMMGYIPTCAEFLPRALDFLKRASKPKAGSAVSADDAHFFGPSAPAAAPAEPLPIPEDDDAPALDPARGVAWAEANVGRYGRPTGTIHYHYLSEGRTPDAAAPTAVEHATSYLGPRIMARCTVTAVRVVKSYAPKKYHCVADLTFVA
jgi:hypothetical protein